MYAGKTLLMLLGIALLGVGGGDAAGQSTVVFVTGDDEYASELSMPMIAQILQTHHGMTAKVLYAENEKGERDRHGQSIPGLEALRTADCVVFYMRFRALPQEQLDEILRYAESGRPMIGLRTSSHAFKYEGPPNDRWNNEFARRWFGQQWISHYGHGNSTQAHIRAEAAEHPIVRGVEPELWLHSWLYVMNEGDLKLPEDCQVLMTGDAVRGTAAGGERFGKPEPLAWYRELPRPEGGAQRTFYTSLGHPRDFALVAPRRLLVNAVYWALGRESEIPPYGANVEIVGEYDPPDPQ